MERCRWCGSWSNGPAPRHPLITGYRPSPRTPWSQHWCDWARSGGDRAWLPRTHVRGGGGSFRGPEPAWLTSPHGGDHRCHQAGGGVIRTAAGSTW